MSIARLLTQTVQIEHYDESGVDDHNDPVPAYGDPVDVDAYVEQRQADEENVSRETAVSGWKLFLPASASVAHRDRVVYGDYTFEVNGTPHEVWNPRTEEVHHIEADLVLIEGTSEESS